MPFLRRHSPVQEDHPIYALLEQSREDHIRQVAIMQEQDRLVRAFLSEEGAYVFGVRMHLVFDEDQNPQMVAWVRDAFAPKPVTEPDSLEG